jgi:F0F1-type ATP synthase membrane subunit b/b'
VELVTAAVLLAACVALYRLCLPALGDLFEQRQLKILETITKTAE